MTRVRAPQLKGRGWLNTGGEELTLAKLRGKIVLLDFWTFCCINCLHVLDELRALEERYADVLVVIGVHSPKFEHERDPQALVDAVRRYDVAHPVLDDPQLLTWGEYTAKAWPTLAVIDPTGYVVATMAGEGHADALDRLIAKLVVEHEAAGTLHRGSGPYVAPPAPAAAFSFPGKAVLSPGGTLLVADSANHRVVEVAVEDFAPLRQFGSGQRGRGDGSLGQASFSEPGGMCVLPAEVAARVGYDVVVADTVNHLLRGLDSRTGAVSTVAGTGRQWRRPVASEVALEQDLSSPWDLAWYDGRVIIAMAGIHQLWWFEPIGRRIGVYAGTTVEALRDGDLAQAWLAQPSGLSVSADGRMLWFVDSETSALRYVQDGQIGTAVGQGLFEFGHTDGPAAQALLQHPLGVCALPDGRVLVADTYNRAVREYDPVTRSVSTVERDLAEPSDLVLLPDGRVVLVESACHRLSILETERLAGGRLGVEAPAGTRFKVERAPILVAPGPVTLEVIFTVAPGQKLDESYGPATRLQVSASPPHLLTAGTGEGAELSRELVLADGVDRAVLQVVAQAATCDAEAEHPACHLTRQDWGVPIVLDPAGSSQVRLILRGLEQ